MGTYNGDNDSEPPRGEGIVSDSEQFQKFLNWKSKEFDDRVNKNYKIYLYRFFRWYRSKETSISKEYTSYKWKFQQDLIIEFKMIYQTELVTLYTRIGKNPNL